MSRRVFDLPIRAWTALSGAALSIVFGMLIVREAAPEWRRHQLQSFELQRSAAERALKAAEDQLRQPAMLHRRRELTDRLQAAEGTLGETKTSGAHDRARQELQRAEDELASVQDNLQKIRAEYQTVERDFLLVADDAKRRALQGRLEALRVEVDRVSGDRDRAAAKRDDASQRLRAITAARDAAQAELAKLSEPVQRARADLAVARRPEVRQFLLDPLGRVDRCTTCHVASERPGFEAAPEPLRTHVGHYLSDHPPETFGCTICHGGQGRATRQVAAHGRVPHWREPLLSGDLVGGRCALCHRGDVVPGEPHATAGRQLFREAGCQGCHDVEGLTAARIGPPLAGVGSKVRAEWLAWWLRDPKAYLPQTRMPNFLLTDQEIADLSAFLLRLVPEPAERQPQDAPRRASVPASPPAPATPSGSAGSSGQRALTPRAAEPTAIARGEALYRESRCVTCHAVGGRGGTIGPDLGRVASKVRDTWLREFLRDPARLTPGTRMPRYRFTDEEAADLAAYVWSELRDFDEASWPAAPSVGGRPDEGRRLVRTYGCFGCHEIPGFEQTGRIGAELTGYADKPVDRLDFGLRRDVGRTWRAWTATKLRDPRGFRDGLKMPDFRLSDQERFSLLLFLASLTEEPPPAAYRREPVENAYRPEGRFGELAAELNCLVCHSIRGRGGSLAPDLTREGSRVNPVWLRRFLDRPNTIRVYLEERMPRFRLTREEIEVIATYIENVLVDPAVPKQVFARGEITTALVERGRELYYKRYACDACHQIGMEGGAVGPDLTVVAERLTEGWVYAWLRDSRALDANAREPVYELPDEEARAVTAFLLSLKPSRLYSTPD